MNEIAKSRRKLAIGAVKRELIRSAAKQIFANQGLDDTSVREIAKQAGYTTGAIYFHYSNKEELYADILRESLDNLYDGVASSVADETQPVAALAAAFRALVGYYDENPRDLDLSLYLLNGTRPRGLTPALNRELNRKLLAVLDVYRVQLAKAGVEDARLSVEVGGLFDEMIGCLVASHTGRLKVIGTNLASVVDHHVANLAARFGKASVAK